LELYILSISSVTTRLSLFSNKLTDSALTIFALVHFQRRIAVFRIIPVITGLAFEQILIVDNNVGGERFTKETRLTVAN
jgi:hypothetical protein